MTYSKRFGNYGVYTDGMLYIWFKDKEKALDYWAMVEKNSDEWLEDYDAVELREIKNGEILHIIEA